MSYRNKRGISCSEGCCGRGETVGPQWSCSSSTNGHDSSNGTGVGAAGAGTSARAVGAASCSSSRSLQVHQKPDLLKNRFASARRQALQGALHLRNTKCCYVGALLAETSNEEVALRWPTFFSSVSRLSSSFVLVPTKHSTCRNSTSL
jgi:hypothetical protein